MEIAMPLSMNLLCYNAVGKATSVMSKNIEPGIINYVSLYQIQAKFTKLSQSTRKQVQTSCKVENRVESASWKTL